MKRPTLLLFFVLVWVLPSIAQYRDRDAVILRAEYGIGNSWADVTQRVRSLVQGNTLNFRVDNNTLRTDPRPGQKKILRLEIREGNRTRQMTFRENDYVRLRGYSPFGDLEIIRGRYGIGNRSIDVTARLNAMVRGDQLRLRVSNEAMGGDPVRNQRKALIVQYRYDGRPNQVTVAEGDFLNIPGGGYGGSRDDDRRGGYDNRGGYGGGGNNRGGGYGGGNNSGDRNYNGGLQITRAEYGEGNRMADVTRALSSQVQGGQLVLRVSNQTMGGDPAPNQPKTLTVWYTINGRSEQVTVREGETLDLDARDQQRRPN
jgi:hypothetical protein